MKLARQANDRHDVVMPMRMMVDDALALHGFDQRLQMQIAGRHFGCVALRAGNLLVILARLDELFSHHRSRLGASPGERGTPLRVRPVRHLDAASDSTVVAFDDEVFDGTPVAEFEVDRLAAVGVDRGLQRRLRTLSNPDALLNASERAPRPLRGVRRPACHC